MRPRLPRRGGGVTGPEHYQAAENIMKALEEAAKDGALIADAVVMGMLAKAQVHATLASAASDALYTPDGMPEHIYAEWARVADGATQAERQRWLENR